MTNYKTKKELKFKSVNDLYAFMDQQSYEDFEIYSKMYHFENPKWNIIKENGKSKVVKYEEVKKIDVLTMDNINCVSIIGGFAYYECECFKGKIKVNLEKNENFINSLDNNIYDSNLWDKMVLKSA